MESIFGAAWEALTLDDVAALLSEAGDEGLTWEAKGTERPHAGSVRKHVSAFANAVGGFYIVGATRDDDRGPWRIDPIDFRGDEPTTWLSRVIRNGMRPVPRFDVKEWAEGSGHVAVVMVDPEPEPPCVTSNGEVFVRVSGESVKITDPTLLRRLLDQGRGRAEAAQTEADRAIGLPQGPEDLDAEAFLRIRLGMAAVGQVDDVAGRIFTESFQNKMLDVAERLPPAPLLAFPPRVRFEVTATQDAISVREASNDNNQRWTIRVAWDGSVSVFLDLRAVGAGQDRLAATAIFGAAVRPAAKAAQTLLPELGTYGRAHLVLLFVGKDFLVGDMQDRWASVPGRGGMLPIRTWTDSDGELAEGQFSRMRRELIRGCGIMVWEPEPDDSAQT